MLEGIDIALVLIKIRPLAKYRMSDSYENLKNTWEDKEQALPTEKEIQATWEDIQKEASEPQIITPPVNQDTADMWEALFALSAELDALKGGN